MNSYAKPVLILFYGNRTAINEYFDGGKTIFHAMYIVMLSNFILNFIVC